MTYRNASLNIFTFPGWVSIFSRLNVVTVKKYVPPFVRARRYRIVIKYMQCWVSFLNSTYAAEHRIELDPPFFIF